MAKKIGMLLGFDRTTGKKIWQTELGVYLRRTQPAGGTVVATRKPLDSHDSSRGVVRVSPDDGSMETLYPDNSEWLGRAELVHAMDGWFYFTSYLDDDADKPTFFVIHAE